MDSVYLYNREVPISYDLWTGLCKRLDWLARHWEEPRSPGPDGSGKRG